MQDKAANNSHPACRAPAAAGARIALAAGHMLTGFACTPRGVGLRGIGGIPSLHTQPRHRAAPVGVAGTDIGPAGR